MYISAMRVLLVWQHFPKKGNTHMKTKTIKKVSLSAVVILILVAMLFAGSGIGGVTTTAASYIRKTDGNITTNIEDYFDSNVVQKLPDTVSSDQLISVILEIDSPSVLDAYEKSDKSMSIGMFSLTDEAKAIKNRLSEDKLAILEAIEKKGIEYQTGAEYTTVLNGFEIIIKAGVFETVLDTLGDNVRAIVGEEYQVSETELVENEVSFDEDTGIFDSEGFDYDGSGVLVAVLDTGLDYTHSAFSPNSFNPSKLAITKDEIAERLGDTRASEILSGLSADDVYINDKVPFSFDYADSDSDVYSLHNNHGTHVSGVIVGNDDTIRGVAPNAQLVSMKIFSDVRESAYTSWILSALEDCVILGVDVINMSLGTSSGFSRESDKEAVSGVYDRIREQGISLVVAASNSFSSSYGSEKNGNLPLTSNPDSATVGSPSTYEGAFSVASINGVRTSYILYGDQIIYFEESTDAATEAKEFFNELLPEGTNTMEYEFVLVPGAGREADYLGMDVTGKIVLIKRGFTTFEEKAEAAKKMGAAGAIIYNNVSGDIRMNVGTTDLPVCSISQTDGEMLAEKGKGKIKVSRSQTSGPFMSDFSSWGPTPDLRIKPEITAHGGNILSAVTGGGYDRLSGTSMACPNMAGVVALMREHVAEKYGLTNDVEINAMVNRLLMSTADIVKNQNGLPYSVRKQGAGLANLTKASTTPAYILTYDRLTNELMGKSKIELGDDANKTGVYTLSFDIQNFSSSSLVYKLSAIVMTEGVSETKTHKGDITVTEDGYILDGATVTFEVANGTKDGEKVVVGGNSTAKVKVTITLSDSDKKYLDNNFENGMYVEGFIKLEAVSGTDVDLSAPYLAFYGDWTKAPLFDIDYFETHADELNDSIETLDKTLPDAYATRPIGGVSLDYVNYLGSYYFVQDPSSTKIVSAKREYIAISNVEGTVHSLRFVWGGLLRNAEKIEITITDDATGEVIYHEFDEAVRKSYGDGGTIRPSNIEIEFDAYDYNLKNNSEYTVRLVGYLDYGNGGLETNENNVFEFPLTVDFEAPAITGCEFYTEYDRSAKKNRLYARMAVYDNHYAMALMLGYVADTGDSQNPYKLVSFDQYLTPVYSVRDGITYVEYELTDYIQDIKNNSAHKNTFTVACYDYALNEATYEISLPDEYIDFYFEEKEITLSPNQLYTLTPLIYPETEWGELLHYEAPNKDVVRVVNNKIVAVAPGKARIRAYKEGDRENAVEIIVTVLAEGEEGYKRYDKPVADKFMLTSYDTLKAYYVMDTDERELGETGDTRILETTKLKFYPSESIKLYYALDAFFPENVQVVFEAGNENIVKVDQNGVITAQSKGVSSVTVRVLMDGKSTYYSQTLSIEVKDPFVTTAPSLTHYYGLGGKVEIPSDLMITQIGDFAFSNYEYIEKTEDDIISEDEPDTTKQWYIGDDTITEVIIPEGVKKIGAYAFAGLTALKKVTLPSTIESIEYGAFYGCTALEVVNGIEHVQLINKEAFYGCNLKGTLNLGNARAVGDYAFAGNAKLEVIVLPSTLQSIGAYTFAGNEALKTITVNAEKVKYGPYVFSGCTSLEEVAINSNVIPEGAFYGSTSLKRVTIGRDVLSIGEFAFGQTAVTEFNIADGNKVFKNQAEKSYVLSSDGKTLILVAPGITEFEPENSNITAIGRGAFSSNTNLVKVTLPNVTSVGAYAFAYCEDLGSVTLGELTKLGEYAFFKTAITELPKIENLSEIAKYAFGYTKIEALEIPAGTVIGEGAFCECQSLKSIVIGDNVKIGTSAFLLGRDNNSILGTTPDPEFLPTNKFYSYEYNSPLTSLKIGNNVVIGDSAFLGAAKLTTVELGEGVSIGDKAFYNACSLVSIDLSKVISIGDAAFSGDELYMYLSSNGGAYATNGEGMYVFKRYAPKLVSVDLSSAQSIGEQAFLYCDKLVSVKLGASIKVIPAMAFYGTESLKEINLENITKIETNSFYESGIEKLNLSSVTLIEKYAFVYCEQLKEIVLNPSGTIIEEGAFAYCSALNKIENLNKVTEIGAYAFAYTSLVKADLSSAESIGDHAFLKETLTSFEVKLSDKLTSLGDNPFAFCKLEPFSKTITETFNGKEYSKVVYTYDITDSVRVIDGSLYCDVPYGMELITYAGTDDKNVVVAEGTVRISARAFAGSDVIRVSLPYTVASIGHMAFYDCQKLAIVAFSSYEAPNLEEEFDPSYYDSMDNLPATGDYEFVINGTTEVVKPGIEIVPYYMWNLTDGKYSNVYYGATFVDYVGKVDSYIVMIAPSNGLYYDSFIYDNYFTVSYEGDVAADDTTLFAISEINKLVAITDAGGSIKLEHEELVKAARAAYDAIATKAQQALVYNLSALMNAEDRIAALKSELLEEQPPTDDGKGGVNALLVVVIIESVIIGAAVVAGAVWMIINRSKKEGINSDSAENAENAENADGNNEKTAENDGCGTKNVKENGAENENDGDKSADNAE